MKVSMLAPCWKGRLSCRVLTGRIEEGCQKLLGLSSSGEMIEKLRATKFLVSKLKKQELGETIAGDIISLVVCKRSVFQIPFAIIIFFPQVRSQLTHF